MKIAVIGAGISGLAAAYTLKDRHDVTVFEKNDYAGGHSRTISIPVNGRDIPVDTGFIVFNDRNYPTLLKLFHHLGVPYEKSDMSFGVSIDEGRIEYSSNNIFAQAENLWRPDFWCMLRDILKFNRTASQWLEKPDLSLGDALDAMQAGTWFRRYYIQAMGAAIWSCSSQTILKFPAASFVRFFQNHGLLTVFRHPQWYTVTNGSREYVARLTESFKDNIRLSCPVRHVERTGDEMVVHTWDGNTHRFDKIVFACHADQALAILKDGDALEKKILGSFEYQENSIVVHGDESFMPRRKASWASWIYLDDSQGSVALSYWMNNLQNKDKSVSIIETLNPPRRPAAHLVYDEHNFRHPVFTRQSVSAQGRIGELQGRNNCYYCGAWQKYGFHEDGIASAVSMLRAMKEPVSWL